MNLEPHLSRLFSLRHPDPHAVLGVHPEPDGLWIRAFRPEAQSVEVLPDAGGSHPMQQVAPGLFELKLPPTGAPFAYRLKITYPQGALFVQRDPYAFLPTLGEMDLHFFAEGRHFRSWEKLGAHPRIHQGVAGVAFAVWAPSAEGVSVVGDFNSWDGRLHPMRSLGRTGIWELFVPELSEGARYKFELHPRGGGAPFLKADPYAFRTEVPPATASVVHPLDHYHWGDAGWMAERTSRQGPNRPWSIYEVHLGSWRHAVEDAHTGASRPLSYREVAPLLCDYVSQMGFTHVELMPVAEHPFGGSWGYQVGAYFAPSARYGHPDDFRFLVDMLHQRGIGVLIDWVPGHFPRDQAGLAHFDGSALYEHADPRLGAHPDWGTLIFNYGRTEVKNFLISNALFWLDQYHLDGLRVDAVASMLYLDYSRPADAWLPNRYGGRENLEAISFLRELTSEVRAQFPGTVVAAEESTAWPKVTHPPEEGGLGFHFKWNMGWMHDTLQYFSKDPVYRRHHHHQLTFGLLYAFTEKFILPLSHDEVVHGKGSLLDRMPGDAWQKFANLRALFGWMWAHPGKKLLFMGGEFGQGPEWNHDRSLDWHLAELEVHHGVQRLTADLNRFYREAPALFELDDSPEGFSWVLAEAEEDNVLAFLRRPQQGGPLLCLANFSPVVRRGYRVGLPGPGRWKEVLNTDASLYGGSGVGNAGAVQAEPRSWHGQPASAEFTLPPLGVLWFRPEG